MNLRGKQEVQVRRFLLGQLEENERQQVEETLMVDTGYREQVLLVEESLIEDYVDGILPADEQKAFETYFVASTQQRRRVKIARLLNTYSFPDLTDSDPPPAPPPSLPRRWPIGLVVRNHPVVFTSVVVASLLLILLGVFQGIRLWRENAQYIEARQRKLEIEQELARLSNTPANQLTTPTFPLALVPGALRDANNASTLSMPFTSEIIELRLILTGNVYPRYAVELNRVGGEETYRIDGLNGQQTGSGMAVVVRIPSRLLSRGDYKLSLIGIAPNGNKTKIGEYVFAVDSQ